jgi:hypothetical protein
MCLGESLDAVVLVAGEAPPGDWLANFRKLLNPHPVDLATDLRAGYLSERRFHPRKDSAALKQLFRRWLRAGDIVWAHNQSLGRNLPLTSALIETTREAGATLVMHHHDWWFDNRWQRWPEIRASGFPHLRSVARTVFSGARHVRHATINSQDARMLRRYLPATSGWLPNPIAADESSLPQNEILRARRWLHDRVGTNAPVWLMPIRLVRRKNIAEAILLTRWLRPEAWLVTTGAPSSQEEVPYAKQLATAAHRGRWNVRLSLLEGAPRTAPSVPALVAASETLLLTSVQEGFGLPFLEAAIARRPIIARRLANVSPDLARFGFRFPHSYDDILVPPGLFDWKTEVRRQTTLLSVWKAKLPAAVRPKVAPLPLLRQRSGPVPFSQLTLAAQMEILNVPVAESWSACVSLNPFLTDWRAREGKLSVSPWPQTADRWLGGAAYGRRFLHLLRKKPESHANAARTAELQRDFMAEKLGELHPLMLNSFT